MVDQVSTKPWSVGLMTGTVLDGNIDVAFLRTDGRTVDEFGPFALVPYQQDVMSLLKEALESAQSWQFAPTEPAIFQRTAAALTEAQSDAVLSVAREAGIDIRDVDIVGFHGQTVLHRGPSKGAQGRTRQLGDPGAMAQRLGTDIVFDMRADDMADGGQGAPLAAVYHASLLDLLNRRSTAAFLNLGGVANITWAGSDELLAFDTGPANAPINDWIRSHTGSEMDRDGLIAASGTVDDERLARLLAHPYLVSRYPKSLDRNDFPSSMAEGLNLATGAATLTAFTAASITMGLDLLPKRPQELLVSGGGRHNPTLLREIGTRTGCAITDVDDVGLRGDAIEAEAFAFLAARRRRELPATFPSTSGATRPVVAGGISSAVTA